MAQLDHILVPEVSGDLKINDLADAASSAEQAIGFRQKFTIIGTGAFHMKRGVTGMSASVTGDYLWAANINHAMATSNAWSHIRVFNDSGAAIDVHIMKLQNS